MIEGRQFCREALQWAIVAPFDSGGDVMLRAQLNDAMKEAMRGKDQRRLSTIRLILAALKDRDIAARTTGDGGPISDTAILSMLQGMVKQRRESVTAYTAGGRTDLVEQENAEIAVIEGFLPRQMDDAAVEQAAKALIAEIGAAGIKDMGRTMNALKERYPGQMDFAKASGLVKSLLS